MNLTPSCTKLLLQGVQIKSNDFDNCAQNIIFCDETKLKTMTLIVNLYKLLLFCYK